MLEAYATTDGQQSAFLRLGSNLLALSAVGLLAAPFTILLNIPDLSTRPSRHAFAGALGLAGLAALEFILAVRVRPTIAPQIIGLLIGATGWILCAAGMRRRGA